MKNERGAVAVEFALLLPILVLMLALILDYGVWYSDSIGIRQGAREAGRMASVSNFAECASEPDAALKTVCLVENRSGTLNADLAVKVTVEDGLWLQGKQLTVCTIATEGGMTGLAPMPAGGRLRTSVTTRVEVTQDPPDASSVEPLPAEDWDTWC